MAEFQRKPEQLDAEEAQRRQQAIDTAQGPGPVLDQDAPAPMPLFDENRPAGTVPSAVDPADFAALSGRSGEELDRIRPIEEGDAPGVAGRAQSDQPSAPPDV